MNSKFNQILWTNLMVRQIANEMVNAARGKSGQKASQDASCIENERGFSLGGAHPSESVLVKFQPPRSVEFLFLFKRVDVDRTLLGGQQEIVALERRRRWRCNFVLVVQSHGARGSNWPQIRVVLQEILLQFGQYVFAQEIQM